MVYPRKPYPINEQIRTMRGYVRSLHATTSRAYREFFGKTTYKRRETPFEIQLRSRRIQQAIELEKLGKAALAELIRQKTISIAQFKIGDQILVTICASLSSEEPRRYLIWGIRPSKRLDDYCYQVRPITKDGHFFKRPFDLTICPNRNILIELCDRVLAPETISWRDHWVQREATRRASVVKSGDITCLTVEKV